MAVNHINDILIALVLTKGILTGYDAINNKMLTEASRAIKDKSNNKFRDKEKNINFQVNTLPWKISQKEES